MDIVAADFQSIEDDLWTIENCIVGSREFMLELHCEDSVGESELAAARSAIANIESLVTACGEMLLENYSRELYGNLGVDPNLLVEETASAVSAAAKLVRVYVWDSGDFELSFHLPWDPNHCYDVEFEDGEPQTCSVNG